MLSFIIRKRLRPHLILALLFAFIFMAAAPTPGFSADKKMAVLPWKVRSAEGMEFLREALSGMLNSRLGAHDDISIVRADKLKSALKEVQDNEITPDKARSLGKELKVDYVLTGSVTLIGKAVSLDANLIDVASGKSTPFSSTGPSHDSIVALADNLSKEVFHHFHPEAAIAASTPPLTATAPAPTATPAAPSMIIKTGDKKEAEAAKAQVQAQQAPSFWKSDIFKGQFISLAAGDLDHNGVKELFLLEKTSIKIALIEDKKLRLIKEISATSGVEFVSISLIDTDGDGKVEAYVSAIRNLRASSLVLEYRGNYRFSQSNIGWLLRSGRTPEGKDLLLGQRFRDPDGFYGGIVIMKKDGDQLRDAGPYLKKLPRKVNLYSFTYMNFNSKNPAEKNLLAFDREGRLIVYKKKKRSWSRVWKSKEFYGGTMHRVILEDDTGSPETYRYVEIERPLLHMDTDGDGREELIVRQSRAAGLFKRFARTFKSFSGGTILSLTWDGEFLTENWRTREINGYVADFFLGGLEGGGKGGQKLVMIVQQDTGIATSTPRSYLLIYDINP
ncbi:MAG: hypothetical protein ACE5EZ_02955 [Thermodesulfobacteriota bacterium]